MNNNLFNSRPPSFNASVYDAATECCLRRMRRHCTLKYPDDKVCYQYCKMDIRRYIGYDTPQAYIDLYMMQAYKRAHILNMGWKSPLRKFVTTMIWIVVIAAAVYGMRTCVINSVASKATTQMVYAVKHKDFPRVDRQIWETLEQVAEDMTRGIDYNNNGSVNCQDAVLSFYTHYPEKKNVVLAINYYQGHAFAAIKIGRWRILVEPQAVWGGHATYSPNAIWGAAFSNGRGSFDVVSYSELMRFR